jgi:hypothetical protein
MKRTTVMLPEELRVRAANRAKKLGVSLGELIRRAMESMLGREQETDGGRYPDDAVYDGPAPPDLSERHDDYLYGPEGKP